VAAVMAGAAAAVEVVVATDFPGPEVWDQTTDAKGTIARQVAARNLIFIKFKAFQILSEQPVPYQSASAGKHYFRCNRR